MAQGFAVVNADSRSDGTAELLSQSDSNDTYDVVQWAAGNVNSNWPHCDGRVARLGVS
jgi:predicted acyl esterase